MQNMQQVQQPPPYIIQGSEVNQETQVMNPHRAQVVPIGCDRQGKQRQHQVVITESHQLLPATEKPIVYKWRNSIIAGSCHIVVGLLCVGFGSGAYGVDAFNYDLGLGIWGGAMFIVTGSCAIIAANLLKRCVIISHAVTASVSMPIGVAGAGLCIYGAIMDSHYTDYPILQTEKIAMNATMSCLFFVDVCLASWSLAICGMLCNINGDYNVKCGCYGCDECYNDQTAAVEYVTVTPQQFQRQTLNEASGPSVSQPDSLTTQEKFTEKSSPPGYPPHTEAF